MYVFTSNLRSNCRMYKFLYDTATYCFRSEQCDSFDIYVYNLGKNYLPISLYFLQIIETLIVMAQPASLHEVEKKYRTIGTHLSKIFTCLVGINTQHSITPA